MNVCLSIIFRDKVRHAILQNLKVFIHLIGVINNNNYYYFERITIIVKISLFVIF